MSAWQEEELQLLRDAWEVAVACPRPDGTLHGPVSLWHAVVNGGLYIRSAKGTNTQWFHWALRAGTGWLEVGDARTNVRFSLAAPMVHAELDAALHAKYHRFGPHTLAAITGNDAQEFTLLVVPLDAASDHDHRSTPVTDAHDACRRAMSEKDLPC